MEDTQTQVQGSSEPAPKPVFLDTSSAQSADPLQGPPLVPGITQDPSIANIPASVAFKVFLQSVLAHYVSLAFVVSAVFVVGVTSSLGYFIGQKSGKSLIMHESASEALAARFLAAGAILKVVDENGKEIKVVKASDATQIVSITNLSFTTGSDTSVLSELSQLYALRTLGLTSVPITQAEFIEYVDKAPSALSSLQLSDLKEIRIDAELMQRIVVHFPALKTFYAKGVAISDDIFPAIAQALQLGSLNVAETETSDVGIAALGTLKFSSLDVSKTSVTDKGLLQLKPFVKTLGIGSLQLSNNQLKTITEYFVNLQSLDISNNMDITDESIPTLVKLTGLTSLNAKGTQISEAGVKLLLESLPACKVQR